MSRQRLVALAFCASLISASAVAQMTVPTNFRAGAPQQDPPYQSSPGVYVTPTTWRVTFSWSPVAGADNYSLEVSTTTSFPTIGKSSTQAAGTATSQLWGGLTSGVTYYFRLCAIDRIPTYEFGPCTNPLPVTYTVPVAPTPTPSPIPIATAVPTLTPTPGVPSGWTATSYTATTDIAVGSNGAVWFINGGTISRLTATGPQAVTGSGIRIAVDPNGVPWVVNLSKGIYRWNGSGWQPMPGSANDIGIGANGAVWIIGSDMIPYSWNGSGWVKGTGAGLRISVGPDGNPWLVNNAGAIYKWSGTAWSQIPGPAARDISVGPDGTVYIMMNGGFSFYRWSGSAWIQEPGVTAATVAAGPGLHAWVAQGNTTASVITR